MVGNQSPKREKKPDKRRKPTPQEVAAGRSNLIAYRARVGGKTALRSGVYSTIANGDVPAIPGAEEIRARVDDRIAQYVSDLGGADSVAAGQQVILDGVRTSLLVQGLCEAFLNESGLVDKRRRPHGLLKTLATYINSARLGCVQLGLERRTRDAKTLDVRLAEIAEREAEQSEKENEPKNDEAPKND